MRQGRAALTLVRHSVSSGGDLRSFFFFPAFVGHSGVPDDCFAMRGTFDAETREVKLSARQWLLQPSGFVTVDLDGHLAPGGDRLEAMSSGRYAPTSTFTGRPLALRQSPPHTWQATRSPETEAWDAGSAPGPAASQVVAEPVPHELRLVRLVHMVESIIA